VIWTKPRIFAENPWKCHSFIPPRQALHFRSALHTYGHGLRNTTVTWVQQPLMKSLFLLNTQILPGGSGKMTY